ncbi:Protein kinase superfamily protein [Raphanus sativus]|nr:Protein kinase superfamily protein [Raphanus sativus]
MFLNEFASQLGLLLHQIELINFYMLSESNFTWFEAWSPAPSQTAGVLITAIISVLIIFSRAINFVVLLLDNISFFSVKPRILEASSWGSLPHPASTRFLSYEELKEATSNFEAASILSEGGLGKVYRGSSH